MSQESITSAREERNLESASVRTQLFAFSQHMEIEEYKTLQHQGSRMMQFCTCVYEEEGVRRYDMYPSWTCECRDNSLSWA